jgi:hypothetical protein
MAKQAQQRVGLLQGTLDMLILRTFVHEPAHGHEIGAFVSASPKLGKAQLTLFISFADPELNGRR